MVQNKLNQINNQFSTRIRGIEWTLKAIKFACFNFLAVTTAIMVSTSFHNMLVGLVGNGVLLFLAKLGTIGIIYLMIDHGLDRSIVFLFESYNKSETNTQKVANRFLNVVILFVACRFLFTVTSSWWSAGEIGELSTNAPNSERLIQEINRQDSLSTDKMYQAKSEMMALRNSHDQRINQAKRAGHDLIESTILEGSIHQIRMWRSNPTFFDALSPASKHYKQNKAYANKVHSAQAKAKQMLQEAINQTRAAEQLYYSIHNDTVSILTKSIIGTIGNNQINQYENKLARRTHFVLLCDIIAGLFGLLSAYLIALIRIIRGDQVQERRTFGSIFRLFVQKKINEVFNYLEQLTGLIEQPEPTTNQLPARTTHKKSKNKHIKPFKTKDKKSGLTLSFGYMQFL